MKGTVVIVEDQFIEANSLRVKLSKAGYQVCGIASSCNDALRLIEKEKPDIVLIDIMLKGELTGIDLGEKLRESGTAFVYISANTNEETLRAAKATRPYGFIVKPFREKDLLITLEIAQYHNENNSENDLKQELYFQRALNEIIFSNEGKEQRFLQLSMTLQRYLPFDLVVIKPISSNGAFPGISFLRIGFVEYKEVDIKVFEGTTDFHGYFQNENKANVKDAIFVNGAAFDVLVQEYHSARVAKNNFGMGALMVMTLELPDKISICIYFYSKSTAAYNSGHIKILRRINQQLNRAVENILSADNLLWKDRSKVLLPIAQKVPDFTQIIGKSHNFLKVLDYVRQVAPVNTSVLLLGESGTGKEIIAHAIHHQSLRNCGPYIKVNCASLPANLIESELFGYEKGAFTGAVNKRIGKFERAHNGTIFLDEIGELPFELQSKLLRVLQDSEFERIGGNTPVKIDVRVVAATNRNLEKEVAEGKFRLDLFYRLNVFPIKLPSLQDRKEDIPLLMDYFLYKFNKKFNKDIRGISPRCIEQATEYLWPGNVRELENCMERAIILATGGILDEIFPTLGPSVSNGVTFTSIGNNEREYIIKALKKCGWKVWGTGGAAELLNIPPSTLSSKIKKFGIKRGQI